MHFAHSNNSRIISFVFYALSMLTSLINFIFYPILTRVVDPHTFGEVQFLITILFQLTILFLALNILTSILVAKHTTNAALITKSLSGIFNFSTIFITLVIVILLIFNQSFFKFDSNLSFIALVTAILTTVPFTVSIGKLQGTSKFIDAGILSLSGAILKVFLSLLLGYIYGTSWAVLLGYSLGQIIALVPYLIRREVHIKEIMNIDIRYIRYISDYYSLVFITGASIVLLNSISIIDTIYIKSAYNPFDAGLYAGISTLAKVALYIVSPIMWMIIPLSIDYNKNKYLINRMIILSCLLCLLLVTFYWFFGTIFIKTALGLEYIKYAKYLIIGTLAMSLASVSLLLSTIIAANKAPIVIVRMTIMMLLIIIIFIAAFGLSIEIILSFIALSSVAGVIYYIYIMKPFKKIPNTLNHQIKD